VPQPGLIETLQGLQKQLEKSDEAIRRMKDELASLEQKNPAVLEDGSLHHEQPHEQG